MSNLVGMSYQHWALCKVASKVESWKYGGLFISFSLSLSVLNKMIRALSEFKGYMSQILSNFYYMVSGGRHLLLKKRNALMWKLNSMYSSKIPCIPSNLKEK